MQQIDPLVARHRDRVLASVRSQGSESPASDVIPSCFLFALLGGFLPLVCTGHLTPLTAIGAAIGVVLGILLAYK